jgi:hypothetical protein
MCRANIYRGAIRAFADIFDTLAKMQAIADLARGTLGLPVRGTRRALCSSTVGALTLVQDTLLVDVEVETITAGHTSWRIVLWTGSELSRGTVLTGADLFLAGIADLVVTSIASRTLGCKMGDAVGIGCGSSV